MTQNILELQNDALHKFGNKTENIKLETAVFP